jgi:hypothetical protein
LCLPTGQLYSLASGARTDVSIVTTRLLATVHETDAEVAMLRLPKGVPSQVPTSIHLADSTLTRCTGNDLVPTLECHPCQWPSRITASGNSPSPTGRDARADRECDPPLSAASLSHRG